VWFRYPTRKNEWVLKGLNLTIHANETVALVGESGCGKSTMVSLILRFYDVDHGRILLDGRDIREYDVATLRRGLGLVMQEPTLFNYTIAENILYGQPHAYNKEIQEASLAANALEFIEAPANSAGVFEDSAESLLRELIAHSQEIKAALPNGEAGFNDMVAELEKLKKVEEEKGKFIAQEGDIDIRGAEKKNIPLVKGFGRDCGVKGGKLSGGQKQRIAIARAIIRKPAILILDEATSALDEASQRLVQSALDNIMEGRTSIVIAHRLSTVEKCDRILVLEGGVLVEEGHFQELRTKEGGVFAQLASGMQKKGKAKE
jgi:ABC-type multidrug transport system fused ATPase/permease subunit